MRKGKLVKVLEQGKILLRRPVIFSLSLVAIVAAVYFAKPVLWPGGCGFGNSDFGVSEIFASFCKDVPVNSVKTITTKNSVKTITTTKRSTGKTLWDWMSLLGVPLSLAILGFWLQQNQRKRAEKFSEEQKARDELFALDQQKRTEEISERQLKIAADETKEEVLQTYFDRVSVLLVDKNLLAIASKVSTIETQENECQQKIEADNEEHELLDSAVNVIRARTLSILRRFENDSKRKTSVIRFLSESHCLGKLKLNLKGANLKDADLSGVNLKGANLRQVNLADVYLQGVNLSHADLSYVEILGAKLNKANLSHANLFKANLSRANLYLSDLSNADLSNAFLIRANLFLARLNSANLNHAFLYCANLVRADLSGANLSYATLSHADLSHTDFSGAILTGAIFGNNLGLSDALITDLKARGAIYEDKPAPPQES